MKTTEKEISQLIAKISQLTGIANSRKSAIENGQDKFLSYENAACYGGYRLIMIGVNNGAHYGAFNWSSTEPRLKPAVFAERLNGLIVGLESAKGVITI